MKDLLTLSAILLGCVAIPAAQASTLGRLFFTPQQRVQLEHDRTMKTTPPAAASSVLTVNGIVQHKGGARTVWINGIAQDAGNSDEHAPESLPVSVPGQSRTIKLKVGQRLLLDKSIPKDPSATDK
jgi:hypothetical protein